jgi:membrane protease YdiL (CAAX protease family)
MAWSATARTIGRPKTRIDPRPRPRGTVVAAPTGVRPLTTPLLLALHIVPGALMIVGFVLFALLFEAIGFPPIAALLAAIVFVLVPIELGVLRFAARSVGGGIAELIPYRSRPRGRDLALLVPALILLAFLGFGLHQAIEPALIERLFGWLPDWYVHPIVVDQIGRYSANAWIVTLAAYLVVNGLLGPIVEELYFRGYLLPRMERFGRWAPLVNVSLFALYHFWSPWQIVARILGIGATVYAVRAKRSVVLGMVVHCSLNTLGVLLVAGMVLGRL